MTANAPPREPQKCARPNCAIWFVPAHKNHIYCSTLCKGRVHEYRFALNGRR